MLYLVIAKDSPNPEAPTRRLQVRPVHLEELNKSVERGVVKLAGAILGDAGAAVGSALLVEADGAEQVRLLLERDIYSREGVWGSFEIYPFRQAF
jgi:uncharacterized protein YciI